MESGRRSSSPARDGDTKRAKNGPVRSASSTRSAGKKRKSQQRIAPLYKRLPHGPHRLARNEVISNQRARIHGAMVEAVARGGYEQTSVKQVIALAGVSRRSFYEQFANKQACFMATFEAIVRRDLQRIRMAYLGRDGTLEQRARAAFESFAQLAHEDRNATVLVLFEAQKAGVDGTMAVRRAAGLCEHMLARSFAESPAALTLPKPIVRGIAGGMYGAACGFVRDASSGHVDIAQELLDWTLLFQTPAAKDITERMAAGLTARMREIALAYGHGLAGAEAASHDERTRLLQGVLRLATREDYRTLSPPQIADEANVSIDAFCELFADRDDCFLAALDMISDELLAIAADPELVSEEWSRAVRRVLGELMRYLADHPLHARTLAQEGFYAGAAAVQRIVELFASIATLLTEGAPEQAQCQLIDDAVAGALLHTIRCQVIDGRVQLLAALSDHLSYVVLAPFIGADAAVEIVTEPRQPSRDAAAA